MWVGALLGFFKSPKALIGLAVLAAFLIVYKKGREDCATKHARHAVKEAQQWAEKTTAASERAYDRGLQAAKSEVRNQKTVEEIARDAGMEAGADDLCLSADVVERLRQLQ